MRIIEKNPQEQNRRRITRLKYKLSHVLQELHDPQSEYVLSEARKLRSEIISADEAQREENETTVDALVAYMYKRHCKFSYRLYNAGHPFDTLRFLLP